MPLVSVITPTYNHGKYIAECIESVLAQDFDAWEMVVIDDGSTDQTADIAEGYAQKDARIRVIRQENKGIFKLGETYNKALSLSGGKYIAILEGDDYWETGKLSMQVELMENHHGAVLCWAQAASRVGVSREVYQVHPVNITRNRRFYDNDPPCSVFNALLSDFLAPLTYLIRKDALLKAGGFIQVQPFPAVDLSTVLELSKQGSFVFIGQILGTWRVFPEQTTKTRSVEILEGAQKILLSFYHSLSEEQRKRVVITEQQLQESYFHRRIITYARSGRFKLIKKDFRGARTDYLTALQYHGLTEPLWKLRALTGLLFSFFHADVELLAKWIGKGSMK